MRTGAPHWWREQDFVQDPRQLCVRGGLSIKKGVDDHVSKTPSPLPNYFPQTAKSGPVSSCRVTLVFAEQEPLLTLLHTSAASLTIHSGAGLRAIRRLASLATPKTSRRPSIRPRNRVFGMLRCLHKRPAAHKRSTVLVSLISTALIGGDPRVWFFFALRVYNNKRSANVASPPSLTWLVPQGAKIRTCPSQQPGRSSCSVQGVTR